MADGEGRTTVGLSFDQRTNYIFGADSGELVRNYTFDGAGFVNDVIVTRQAAYFTDSFSPVL